MKTRILITGGLGHVGGRIAQYLEALPDTEIFIGTRTQQNVPLWLPSSKIVVTKWESPEQLFDSCQNIDVIIHLAAMNEIDAAKNPAASLQANGIGTIHLIEAAIKQKVKRFINFSTAHVYASPLVGCFDESTCPRPIHPYAIGHRTAEDIVLAKWYQKKIEGIVIRLSNSFGPPSHPNINRWTLLVNDLCRQVVTTKKIRLHSPGLQRRDFITLTDVARAVSFLMTLPREKINHGIFNLGGEWTPTVKEMAQLIAERCKKVLGFSPTLFIPNRIESNANTYFEYKIKAIKSLGFKLTSGHIEEIDQTLKFCQRAFS